MLEMEDNLSLDLALFNRVALLEEMKSLEKVHTGMRVSSISENIVYAVSKSGENLSFPADVVVLACGLRPNRELESLRTKVPHYIPIGDCYKTAKIGNAVRSAVDMVIDMDTSLAMPYEGSYRIL